MSGERRHRIVVIGAGFGGLAVARALREAPVDVTVVEANNFHTFQPLLYQVATAGLDSGNVAYAVRGIFRRQRNAEVKMARVTGIDLAARRITIDTGAPISYDTLVIAAGAVSTSFGVTGVDEHAYPLKQLDDAIAIRRRIIDQFERAAADPSLVEDGALNVVVCGGGPTGVEMAGGLVELYDKVLRHDFVDLPVRRARVVLVEAAPRLLGPFSEQSSRRALRTLTRRRVEVRLGVGVDEVDATRVRLADGTVIPAHTVIWAAGVAANPLAAMVGTEQTRGGRLVVLDDLSLPGHPDVFAIGDIAATMGDDGRPLPQVAQPAIQGGRHVARQIERRLVGDATEPFRYHDKGSMATIGRLDAVADFPNGLHLNGPVGWVAWLGLHLVYLMGFRNRLNVFVNWCWNYLTYDRGSRLLAESQRRPD
ncbi:MAG: NAD(P)/FAD-dependent oxidoreductase [Acidimicrobiales bacterium]